MSKYELIKIGKNEIDLHNHIQVALANIPLNDSYVEAGYLNKPILTKERFNLLTKLLNEIANYKKNHGKKIDLMIFPEVSIPRTWEPMLVTWARTHDIGVIAGLEHRLNSKNQGLNEILAALPYRTPNGSIACAPIRRLKKFYSPEEIFILENERIEIPTNECEKVLLQLFHWRGASFAIYNCFELTSIEHRSLFKAKVDFIVGTQFNRDTNYFSNIIESASRDLHCYVIQVNDSRFGDSRIVSPSKTEKMNPLKIKGGDNHTFLTMSLDLQSLRTHQRKKYGLQKDSQQFKPTPPGFSMDDLNERVNLGII